MMIGVKMSKNIESAIKLLNDKNLVWSDDFEQIRLPLSNLLIEISFFQLSKLPAAESLAEILIKEDN